MLDFTFFFLYSYRVEKEDGSIVDTTKCKGITFNALSGKVVHHEAMKDMVKQNMNNEPTARTVRGMKQIRRTNQHLVITRNLDKKFDVTITKRVFCPGSYVTVPYGYRVW